ncbi:MAG TPA: type II secretion system protein [Parasulfuritortus sp.]
MAGRETGNPGRAKQGGFTLLWALFFVVALGIGMAALGTEWHTLAAREREQQLLFVGDQYRQAIAAFRLASPQGQARYPRSLADLLADPRFANTVRYLRRPYPDPVTGRKQWGLVTDAAGGITGVYSLSKAKPLKTAGFPIADKDFEGATSYRDWVFSAIHAPR